MATVRDLEKAVKDLNIKYGKTEKTAVRFFLQGAYGGVSISIKT